MKKSKNKIQLFLYVSLAIVLGSFTVLFFNFRKQVELQNRILSTESNLISTDSLINNLLQLEADKRGFQITGDITYLKYFYAIRTGCRNNVESLTKSLTHTVHAPLVKRIDSLMQLRLANMDAGLAIFREQGAEAGTAFMQLPGKRKIRESLSESLATLKHSFLLEFRSTTATINRMSDRNVAGLLILLSVFVLLMFVAAINFRRAQQRMIKNHMKFKQAQEIASIGSWEWEFKTGKLRWSQEQFRLFGEVRKQYTLSMDGYLSHFSTAERERTNTLLKLAIDQRTPFLIEHEIIRKDGTRILVCEQGTLFYDPKTGQPAGMFGTTQDITERKKAELELQKTKQELQTIFDNTAEGIYQSTLDGKFIMLNPSMARIFGYDSPQEMISGVVNIAEQIYAFPEERKAMSEILYRDGHIEDYEIRVLNKRGKVIWVTANIRIVKDEQGIPVYYEGTLEDVSVRKQAEENLLNLSNRLQLAVHATGIGIWDWDLQHDQTLWDEDMYRIYQTEPSDPRQIGIIWESLLHPEDAERVKSELNAALEGRAEYDTLFRIITEQKEERYIKGNGLVLRDASGKPERMIGTNTDITSRKRAEEEILQLNRNLDQFANITAHDLQEPIRMVSGFLGLLDKKYSEQLDEQAQSYIIRAKDGADRMSILIRDLLEYSRSSNKAARKEPVDLKSVLDQVYQDMEIAMNSSEASLLIPNSLPVVEGTQSALYRLFLNLVSNGIKFRKKDTAPEVLITLDEKADCWEFHVQDNGIGIAEKDQPKLFQAFQRLHRREDYPGTGLGLITCKKIVEMHGGKIWMSSELGKGTCFHLTIPKMKEIPGLGSIQLKRA